MYVVCSAMKILEKAWFRLGTFQSMKPILALPNSNNEIPTNKRIPHWLGMIYCGVKIKQI